MLNRCVRMEDITPNLPSPTVRVRPTIPSMMLEKPQQGKISLAREKYLWLTETSNFAKINNLFWMNQDLVRTFITTIASWPAHRITDLLEKLVKIPSTSNAAERFAIFLQEADFVEKEVKRLSEFPRTGSVGTDPELLATNLKLFNLFKAEQAQAQLLWSLDNRDKPENQIILEALCEEQPNWPENS